MVLFKQGHQQGSPQRPRACHSAHLGARATASFCAIFNILVQERRPADCRAIKCSRQGSWLGAVLLSGHEQPQLPTGLTASADIDFGVEQEYPAIAGRGLKIKSYK